MLPSNRFVIASAGAGKTTEIVKKCLALRPLRSAIVTFTLNNVESIKEKFFELNGHVPPEVTIYPWYSFVLHEMVRPYQGGLYEPRVVSVKLLNGRSPIAPKANIGRYYFNSTNEIYSDKLGAFALLCETSSKGAVIRRLSDMFDQIFIDEVQDLAGHDIDLIETLLRSSIHLALVGDIRQSTFRTNYASRHKSFVGRGFLKKIELWKKLNLCSVEYLAQSYRCIQPICDLADSIFPDLPPARSLSTRVSGHDGIFIVRSADFPQYVNVFQPQILRFNKKTVCNYPAMNYGASKGLGFERVAILPYGGVSKWLSTGDSSNVSGSADEVYVAITRARQSVAFVYDGAFKLPSATLFVPTVPV